MATCILAKAFNLYIHVLFRIMVTMFYLLIKHCGGHNTHVRASYLSKVRALAGCCLASFPGSTSQLFFARNEASCCPHYSLVRRVEIGDSQNRGMYMRKVNNIFQTSCFPVIPIFPPFYLLMPKLV
jgi:hypothetical protein